MTLSSKELIIAREAATVILEELGLDAYLFEVEPQDAHYELKVECACETDGGWASISLTVPRDKLLKGFDDQDIKRQLFEYWAKKLASCKKSET
jgi:hypothetical protein